MHTTTTTATGRAVFTGAADVWVTERGSGPAVLLLAGLGDPHGVWEPQIEALSGRYRVIAPDNRGVGRTPMPADGVSVSAMAEDAAAVLRELGVERTHVVGFSMGGLIAQELALAHPDAVESLVLLSSYGRADAFLRRTFASWSWLARSADDPAEFLRSFSTWLFSRAAHADGFAERWVQDALADPRAMETEDFRAAVTACAEHDALDRLGAIRAPALVVTGDEDLLTPPRVARDLASRIPGARLTLLPQYAHQSFMESPDLITGLLDRFFKEVAA
jgi:pimeloyl-ACP methyl ester carboxylesterase